VAAGNSGILAGTRVSVRRVPPLSLFDYSAQEHEKLLAAEDRYGNAFVNAYNTTILLSNLMLWPVAPCDLFIRFYSQVKKYHTLSVISSVRLHRVQAKIDLRYFLESTVHAAYTLADPETTNYVDHEKQEIGDARKATGVAHAWIEGAFPDHSAFIKDLKVQINKQTAHAHVVNSAHNFDFVPGERPEIVTTYFDFEDDTLVKLDLWLAAKAGLHTIDLILAVQRRWGGFLPAREVEGLSALIADNDTVLAELPG
jgi:hypothetical protein